ncbi:hypothetical protein Cgig2_025987 [Carnegiea gigantea]|uniref:Uncharacterized protein n=1 Tax=Carnegiea gigantea TaxID=171969 RepID=A0A9Q1K0N3_9CARY|nr:hypothetical protein Cgig2_025987 [Carnegiea gigantea]
MKKMKRAMAGSSPHSETREDVDMAEMGLESPNVPETAPLNASLTGNRRTISHRDKLQRNNPNLHFDTRENPIYGKEQCNKRNGGGIAPQVSENHGTNKEVDAIPLCDHGSRFRALANLDLNVDVEATMEGEEALGNKEDSIYSKEIPNLGEAENGIINLENILEQLMENILGKENISHTSISQPQGKQDMARAGTHLQFNNPTNSQPIRAFPMQGTRGGARSRDFLHMVKECVRMQHPQIIVLLETHVSRSRADDVCNNIGFRGQYRVEAQDYQGGIWILWLEDVIQVRILKAHEQFVTAEISPGGGGVGYLQ